MTSAELRAWIKSRRLSHQEAATLLAMSVDGFRKNLYGRHPISAQTALIVELREREMMPAPGAPGAKRRR